MLVYLSSHMDKTSHGKHIFFCMLCSVFGFSRLINQSKICPSSTTMPDWLIFCLHSFLDRELHVPNLTSFVNSFTSTSFTNVQFRFSFLTFTSRKLRGNNRIFLGFFFFFFFFVPMQFFKIIFFFFCLSLENITPIAFANFN